MLRPRLTATECFASLTECFTSLNVLAIFEGLRGVPWAVALRGDPSGLACIPSPAPRAGLEEGDGCGVSGTSETTGKGVAIVPPSCRRATSPCPGVPGGVPEGWIREVEPLSACAPGKLVDACASGDT